MSERFWIEWPNGTHTGCITDSKRLADAYAKQHEGIARPEAELAAHEQAIGMTQVAE